jgi:hypothetical protein
MSCKPRTFGLYLLHYSYYLQIFENWLKTEYLLLWRTTPDWLRAPKSPRVADDSLRSSNIRSNTHDASLEVIASHGENSDCESTQRSGSTIETVQNLPALGRRSQAYTARRTSRRDLTFDPPPPHLLPYTGTCCREPACKASRAMDNVSHHTNMHSAAKPSSIPPALVDPSAV